MKTSTNMRRRLLMQKVAGSKDERENQYLQVSSEWLKKKSRKKRFNHRRANQSIIK